MSKNRERRVVATRPRADGTYDEVGMLNQRMLRLKTEDGVKRRLRNLGWYGKIRLQWYSRKFDRDPYSTTYVIL